VGDGRSVLGLDATLERRWGKRLWGLGLYRDAVQSSHKHSVTRRGVRWQVRPVFVPLPWRSSVWGLPFWSLMVPSAARVQGSKRADKSSLAGAGQRVTQTSRWLKRHGLCVADGGDGKVKFGWACRRHGVEALTERTSFARIGMSELNLEKARKICVYTDVSDRA
jgi:hypothetical protein